MADLTIADVRAKYPQYKDMPDDQLVEGLHKKYYSDMPIDDFKKKVGFGPVGAAAIPDSKPMAGAAVKPPEPEGWGDKLKGVGEAGLSILSSVPALAKAGIQSLPGTGVKPPGSFMERAASDMYAPRTETGQSILKGVGQAGEMAQALGPEFGGYGSLLKAAGEASALARPALGAIPKIPLPKVPSAVTGVIDKAKGAAAPVIDTLRGVPAKAAQDEALTATKGALSKESSTLGRTAVTKGQEASQAESVAVAVQRNLDQMAERGGRPTLDAQGETVRTAVSGAYDAADKARKAQTTGLYDTARKAAAAREKDGARIDVSGVTPKVEALLEKADNIPDLRAKLSKLINAVTGVEEKAPVAAPLGKGKVTSKLAPPKVAPAPKTGLTYEELDLANKYLKDIAYSGELQGYDAIVRRAALDLSKGLDKQIATFVPEHAAAAAKYAELSQPLESLATRIGKAVTGTEGGLKGEAYSKISAQNLPQRLFSTKDGIELVVDAIAGGKGAKPAARVAAQAQVDQMVEHWIMESARGAKGATGEAAANALRTPQMAATMQAVPKVAERLGKQFASEERMAATGSRAADTAKTAAAEAKAAAGAKVKIDTAIKDADAYYQIGNKDKALAAYSNAMRQALAGEPGKYRAALELIDRAGTLQAKTDKARSLAKKFLWGAGGVAAGMEIKGLMQ